MKQQSRNIFYSGFAVFQLQLNLKADASFTAVFYC